MQRTTAWRKAAALLLLSVVRAQAVVLFGPDESDNRLAPSNGAPWNYVARLDTQNASGVYLGNGFLLTANHVNTPLTAFLNGILYDIDASFAPVRIDGADIKLLRILGDPQLAPLPLVSKNGNDRNKAGTLIGWGVGKGGEVPNQGWNWNDERVERWGLNTTQSTYNTSNGESMLLTAFDRFAGTEEASLALGDSGGALFQKNGNTWELAGIAAGVETPGQSLYDHDSATLFDQPDHNFFVPIALHRDALTAATAIVPEPCAPLLLGLGAAGMLARRRRRRSGAR